MPTITGQIDEDMGLPIIEVEILKDGEEPRKFKALIDTGSTCTHVAHDILIERGAKYIKPASVDSHGMRNSMQELYLAKIRFPDGDDGEPGLERKVHCINTEGINAPVIIGMYALLNFDFQLLKNGVFFLDWEGTELEASDTAA